MKPTIFFSHSSRDRNALLPIRDRLLNGTGNAIEVFMSSDGASIPFGKNWLKEIEEALTKCRLMFVWMTPDSLHSNWIPFESGFAYSKGIRVVPIGFQGVKLEQLPAPINMLQGFNVTSSASLNNIVGIINDEFTLTFPDLYDETFYHANVADVTSEDSPELLDFVRVIECVLWPKVDMAVLHSDWFDGLKKILEEHGTSFFESDNRLLGTGFRVTSQTDTEKKTRAHISIDPLALNTTRKLWATATARLYDANLPYTAFTLTFVPGFTLPDDASLIGSRLLKSDISFDTRVPHVLYRYRNIEFRINVAQTSRETTRLVLLVPPSNTDPIPLLSLLRLFRERRILTVC